MARVLRNVWVVVAMMWGLLAIPESVAAQSKDSLTLRVESDINYTHVQIGFFSVSDFVSSCPAGVCTKPKGFSVDMIRARLGLGYGVFTIETSAGMPVRGDISHYLWTTGFRFDTSAHAAFVGFFRIAYVRRTGDWSGHGGQLSAGLAYKPTRKFALFGEAAGEATSVPSNMHDTGVVASYAILFSGGIRYIF